MILTMNDEQRVPVGRYACGASGKTIPLFHHEAPGRPVTPAQEEEARNMMREHHDGWECSARLI